MKKSSRKRKEVSPKKAAPVVLPSQATALRHALTAFPQGPTVPQLAAPFSKAPKATLTALLETLTAPGQARHDDGRYQNNRPDQLL